MILAAKYLFLGGIALTLLRMLAYGALAIVQKSRAAKRRFDPSFQPPVSVIIAAHNEEKVIAQTVNALLASDYPDFEVIVVDDGSTDATLEKLWSEFSTDRRVRLMTQRNLGKAAALNRALGEATCDFVVALDADTLFLPCTIKKLIRHFSDPRVAAVSGNAKVGNPANWIARLQSIEYICGFNLDRRALDLLNAVIVVPGCVGAWRKSDILEAGGYRGDTVAEDAELTLAIRRRGRVIRYDEQAIAYTEVPESLLVLVDPPGSQLLRIAMPEAHPSSAGVPASDENQPETIEKMLRRRTKLGTGSNWFATTTYLRDRQPVHYLNRVVTVALGSSVRSCVEGGPLLDLER